ncbi:hypothetical protein [Streptomyces sp. NPDC059010]|uniref:hypothetical protein n=1 Tax=Streptomyces sp. NPDC059010 TaxID=3346695 RepID=UPI0036766F40
MLAASDVNTVEKITENVRLFWPWITRSGASLVGMQDERAGGPVGPDVWETCRELIPDRSVFAFLDEHREALFPAGM